MAAARQNEMKDSITVVATKTFTTGRLISVVVDIDARWPGTRTRDAPLPANIEQTIEDSTAGRLRQLGADQVFVCHKFKNRELVRATSGRRREIGPRDPVMPAQRIFVDVGPRKT